MSLKSLAKMKISIKVPIDQIWRIITGADDYVWEDEAIMKKAVKWNFWQGKPGEPREIPVPTLIPSPVIPCGVTTMRSRDPMWKARVTYFQIQLLLKQNVAIFVKTFQFFCNWLFIVALTARFYRECHRFVCNSILLIHWISAVTYGIFLFMTDIYRAMVFK